MNAVIPWATLLALVEPHCAKTAHGRRSMPLERTLRARVIAEPEQREVQI